MESQMQGIWDEVKNIPESHRRGGWLSILRDIGFAERELMEIEGEENYWVDKDIEIKLEQEARKKVREFIIETDKGWARERRLEFVEGKVEELERLHKKMWALNAPFWLRKVVWDLLNGDKWIREKVYLGQRKRGNGNHNQITDAMIERAREYSFEELLEVKNNFALCPFHDDKNPSFYVKNNFGHCFGCGITCDTIDFVIRRDDVSFVEAVSVLNRG